MILLLMRLIVNIVLIPVNIILLIPRLLYKLIIKYDSKITWIAWRSKTKK